MKISLLICLILMLPIFAWSQEISSTPEGTTPPPSGETTSVSSAETQAPAPSETTPTEATEAAENEPAAFPQTYIQPSKEEKKEAKKKKTGPPQKYGDCTGSYWIGQRVVTEKHAGWGWLKNEGSTWRHAKWVMLKETPGKAEAPSRFYNRPNDDNNMQYKLYGEFADYKGYEPNIDSLVPVFILKGFEVIGSGGRIDRKPPGPSGNRKGRISERNPHL